MQFTKVIGHLLAFAVGLTLETEYEFIGTLRISEIMLLVYLIIMLPFGKVKELFATPFAVPVASLGLLWLGSQFISDMANHTSRVNLLKGHANIGMILVSVAAFVVLFKPDPNRFASYLLGLFFCRIINRLRGVVDETATTEYWDRFIASWASCGLILLMLFLLHRKYRGSYVALLTIPYGCASIIFGGRSHGLAYLLTGVGLWYGTRGGPKDFLNYTRRQFMWGGVALFVAAFLVFQVYVFFGLSGVLGDKARMQLRASSNPYNPIAVVSAGRGGLQVAFEAIADRPILGHGSKAYNRKYITRAMRETTSEEYLRSIPVHSCIFGAWVFSGILGVPFWIAILWIHVLFFRSAINSDHPQFVLLSAFLLVEGVWNIFFSPHGYARYAWPPFFVVNILLYQAAEQKRLAWERETVQPERATPSTPQWVATEV
ncbi:hypothetical protein NZK35_02155 [Stieleria sp. ICT_E10.1]|uniref:hypothetical protein n=1 Tax=Stieleria sedimenti TaxID=2976331 RepID=UPI00217F3479|nr:hypothetical protein [Stieleria sedimenti]MCS7465470.1 hypothetical protein [Stieleria sedimenti]